MNVQRSANSMKTLKLSGSRGGAASAFLAVAFATLGLQGTASAQGVTSVIRGTITDASGAEVQAAALTVTDVTKGWSRMTISGTAGEFEFVQLPPADTFSIAVQAPGYKKELRSGIVLETGQKRAGRTRCTPTLLTRPLLCRPSSRRRWLCAPSR